MIRLEVNYYKLIGQLLLTFIVQWKMFTNSLPSHACFD
jgi:hypothetical protein